MHESTEGRADGRSRKWPDLGLVGAYPPPYGGISVHLKRLVDRLEDAAVDFTLYNTVSASELPPRVRSVAHRRGWWFLKFCLVQRCRIAHLVTSQWISHLMFGIAAWLRPGTYVLSVHNMRTNEALQAPGLLRPLLTRWFLRQMDVVVACNSEVARACVETAGVAPESVRIIPAFLPPDPLRAPMLPDSVESFIRTHSPVLFTMIWKLGITHQGHDLYGTDMMIELVARLKADHPGIGLAMTSLGGDPDAIQRTAQLGRDRTGDRLLMINEPLEDVSRLLCASDLFLRPTNTDGDSNSIREALSLGTPVVTSDVVPRPEACVLFRTRDMDHFERAVREALDDLPALRLRVASSSMDDSGTRLLELYAGLRNGTA